jgi:acyl carrier protein
MTDRQLVLRLASLMKAALGVSGEELSQNGGYLFGFDSIQFITLILALEEEFSISLSDGEVDSIHVADDLFSLLRTKELRAVT